MIARLRAFIGSVCGNG